MYTGTYSRLYRVTHVMSPEPQNKYLYIEFAVYCQLLRENKKRNAKIRYRKMVKQCQFCFECFCIFLGVVITPTRIY